MNNNNLHISRNNKYEVTSKFHKISLRISSAKWESSIPFKWKNIQESTITDKFSFLFFSQIFGFETKKKYQKHQYSDKT
jgi:hypothetical protein